MPISSEGEAFNELPVTFARKQDVRLLGDAPWSGQHEFGSIYYYPMRVAHAHIKLHHHLIGFEFEPSVVRAQLNAGPLADLIVKSRSFYFVPAGSTIEIRKEHMCENVLITLDPEKCQKLLPELALVGMTENMTDPALTASVLAFRRDVLAGNPQPDALKGLIAALFRALETNLIKSSREVQPIVLSSTRIRRALDYIECNYAQRVSVNEIANAAGEISAFHFAHVFRSSIGRSPYQCVVERKLHQARQLLADTQDGLASIAYVVGFSSQAHMTETFARRIGVTPTQFRRTSRVFKPPFPTSLVPSSQSPGRVPFASTIAALP